MDKAARAEILRRSYYAKHPRIPVFEPRQPKPAQQARGWFNWSTNFAAFGEINPEHQVGWIEKPDEKPEIAPKTKRNQGVPVLTRIAAKAPKKLTRVYRNAEQLLAERARR